MSNTVVKCPNCGEDWNISKFNACECGAVTVPKENSIQAPLQVDNTSDLPEDEDAGVPPEKLAEHMQNIKFLMAYYGGKKTYIECMPGDNGAFNIPNTNKWLQEFNVKPGADWQVRSFKFAIQDKLRTIGLSIDTLKPLINWLWAYKSTKDE